MVLKIPDRTLGDNSGKVAYLSAFRAGLASVDGRNECIILPVSPACRTSTREKLLGDINASGLVGCCIGAAMEGVRVSREDGFAITFPYAPRPHKDLGRAQDVNMYTVSLERGASFTLRAANRRMDCTESFKTLKNAYHGPGWSIVAGSMKDITLAGYPGLEYESTSESQHKRFFERYYCVNERFYALTSGSPTNESRPASVDRILSSFRLLKPTSRQ